MSAKWYTKISRAMRVRGDSWPLSEAVELEVVVSVFATGDAMVRVLLVVIGEGNPLIF